MLVNKSYLQSMLALSRAAYDSTLMPEGYTDIKKITAIPTGCALLNQEQLTFGFYCQKDGMGYLVFRGTQNIEEWLDDGWGVLVDYIRGLVHKGFSDVYLALTMSVNLNINQGLPITIVGHSLGSALATLAAVNVMAQEINLVTFAGPRVGSTDFALLVEARTKINIRVVNSRDIVTHVPTRPFYCHAGGAITFHGSSLNWGNAHSEELSYGPAIDAMKDEIQTEPNQK